MGSVWSEENRFAKWRAVELAVLCERERRGDLPAGTTEGVKAATYMTQGVADFINRREKINGHDLNAFVEVMRFLMINARRGEASLEQPESVSWEAFENALRDGHPQRWDHCFHEGMTSYDTEEPAMAMLFRDADRILFAGIERVTRALTELAKKHRGTVMIGRTHGQWAQPVTFGKRCLDWLDLVVRCMTHFNTSSRAARVMKLSGAVGMYGTFGPEIESDVAAGLGLEVADVATQIVPLDRRASHMNSLAELAAVVEKISHDLWLLSQSEIGEVREPFGKKQKGSSAMPHKKNPITLEKLFGLARLIRAYAHVMLENVATAHERDISHSSVERIAVPDAYGLLDHMLRQLARVLEGLQVFPDRMAENLAATKEVYASQIVRDLLGKHGVPGETAYRFIQQCAFMVAEKGTVALTVDGLM